MAEFKVSFETTIEAPDPISAAKLVQEWRQNPENLWQYYVQNTKTKDIFSIDLEESKEDVLQIVNDYESFIKNR